MKNKTIKVGLIGLGKMGQNHLRILSMLKNVNLSFIYDISKGAMLESAKKYDVNPSLNLEEDLKTVDAVVIVTPTSTHFEYIKLVSKYVKNIFVEKPLVDSIDASVKIDKLTKDKNLNIQVGFIERYNPAVIELKKIIEVYNNILNIDFTRTNKVSNRITDVDVIIDLMIHDIDLAIYLNGKVENVIAYGTEEDNMIAFASAILRHEGNKYSRLTASRITEKRIRQISVTAENIYIDCNLLRKEIYINKQTVPQSYDYFSLSSVEEAVHVSNQEALLNELLSFIDSCFSKKGAIVKQIPDVYASIETLKVAKKIQEQISGNLFNYCKGLA